MAMTSDGNEDEPEGYRLVSQMGTLNPDPYNMRAEALAAEMCMRGAGSLRTWSEQDMVFTFGGGEVPGTPDFMYEDANGILTFGQVVRVPLVRGMSRTMISETIYCTVLTKLVKSQVWMKSCCIMPNEFIIFLWLPFFVHKRRKKLAEALAIEVQSTGWPFHLRFAVPDHPEALFPPMFAVSLNPRAKKLCEGNLSKFDPRDFQEEEENFMEWDIFAFEETEETEDVTDEYESGDSDREGSGAAGEFCKEQGPAVDENVSGQDRMPSEDFFSSQDHVYIILLDSSRSRQRFRSPKVRYPSPIKGTWGAKPGLQKPPQCSSPPVCPCFLQCIETWDEKVPRYSDIPGTHNHAHIQMLLSDVIAWYMVQSSFAGLLFMTSILVAN
jgi:hypothetical protein